MEDNNKLKLVYVKPGLKSPDKGTYEYEFFFSETPEFVWGQCWDVDNPLSNGDLTPDSTTYSIIKKVVTNLPFKTAEETTCYSMEYATYGILALSWVNIETLEEYPSNGRAVMKFGDTYDEVVEKLSVYDWNLN